MTASERDLFSTVTTVGGLLPPDLLARIAQGDRDLGGLTPEEYHLAPNERLREAISRAWSRLPGAWASFRAAREKLPETDPGTTLTRERWLLILFQELGYGRLDAAPRAVEIEGKSYPISHFRGHIPIHLVGFRIDLGLRARGVAGAARSSPHSLLQEFLNRDPRSLWGFVSNGRLLRLLRDNASLTRQAYVELNLEAMMDREVFSDFALLWLLCHKSRVVSERPEECWLERWARSAHDRGVRALDTLRHGVQSAIEALGRGFLSHRANDVLRHRLRRGSLTREAYYRQILRLVYRLLFLFVAEDRALLLDPAADPLARDRYTRHYSTVRLRRLARRHRGTKHADLYRAVRLVMEKLGSEEGCPPLALPALGSFLWSKEALPDLEACDITNADILAAVRHLAFTEQDHLLRPVDYRNLGSEELGSVYESLLELHPEINTEAATFSLTTAAGHERKTTGSYYTPSSLVQCVLDSALDPVLHEAARQEDPERAILSVRVCDPACGSGHFIIAAAHRIARRLAAIRTGEEEPPPEAQRAALRDVIGHCLCAVDVNPMAVELCKVSLWIEALEPGKPLSFLDHHIQCGNSLLGTTPALLAGGIPDEAFEPLEGDDQKLTAALRRRNRSEREGARPLPLVAEPAPTYGSLSETVRALDSLPDHSIREVREKEERFHRLSESAEFRRAHLLADAWCAAFVWRKARGAPDPVTHDAFLRLRDNLSSVPAATREEIARIACQYTFFHWHLAFPDVLRVPLPGRKPDNPPAGWSGGFDVVLGNPPWEHAEIKEQEWFATRLPEIASAPTAAIRKRRIEELSEKDPLLYAEFVAALRYYDGMNNLVRNSARYPLCARGRINTYAIFAETNRLILGPAGRVGCIVPSGIATDDTTKFFFQDLMDQRALVRLYDFENREGIFPGVHRSYKFCLLTLTGPARSTRAGAEFAFFLHQPAGLEDSDRRFTLSAEDIALLNPNTRTCPVFRTRRDAEITKGIYRRVPVLVREGPPEENPWGVSFKQGLFNMASDSGLFRTREELEGDGWRLVGNVIERGSERYLPLYEAKMIHHFSHRFGDYRDHPRGSESTQLPSVPLERLQDPSYSPLSRYWVPAAEVESRLSGRWDRGWLLGWRDICRSTDERTVIASLLPRVGVGHTCPLMLLASVAPSLAAALLANLSSLALDFAARQKVGGTHLTFGYLNQLSVLPPARYSSAAPWSNGLLLHDWVLPRVLKLAYTSWDLVAFARDCGYDGPPFRWDEDRRFLIRCELDAAFFHLYSINGEEIDYILDTFPIVRKQDEKRYGEYRTKRQIIAIYDAMERASAGGEPYKTIVDPSPADPRVAHRALPGAAAGGG